MATLVKSDRPLLATMLAGRADAYTPHLAPFATFMADRGDVAMEDVQAYFAALAESRYSANTVRVMRQAVKRRLRDAMPRLDFNQAAVLREGLARLDKDVTPPKVQKAPVSSSKLLKREEYERLLAAASLRDGLLLRFLWTTGCRVSELTGARLSRCRPDGQRVFVTVLGKAGKERTLRIPAKLYMSIVAEFHGDTYLFETRGGKRFGREYVSGRVHHLAEQVLGRRLGAHCLRHSFATRMVKNHPAELPAISRYLGHSSTAITTDYYVHVELDDAFLFDGEDA